AAPEGSTVILSVAGFPFVTFLPELADCQTKFGASNVALQSKALPPVLAMVTSLLVAPSVVKRSKDSEGGLTEPTGGTSLTVNLTFTVCGLPASALLLSVPITVIVPLYEPDARLAEFTFTVKVTLPFVGVVGSCGTTSQSALVVPVIVTPLSHAPVTPTVK